MRWIVLLASVSLVFAASCGSDSEAPYSVEFQESGIFDPVSGGTFRFVEPLAGDVFDVPTGIGQSSVLKLGGLSGLHFEAALMSFDFDSLSFDTGRTVDSAAVDIAVVTVSDTLPGFSVQTTFHELFASFSEDDTITTVPPYDPAAIGGPDGTVRSLSLESGPLFLDRETVQRWVDGLETPWPNGIVMIADPADTTGIVEFKSANYGSDPPVVRIWYDDGTERVLAADEDYNIVTFTGGPGLHAVGGTATRVSLPFTLDGFDERAIVQRASLVLTVDGDAGLGATPGEIAQGITEDFFAYVYTPDSADPGDPGFLEGTGVAITSFDPRVTETIRFSITGFVVDIVEGERENKGLILQSNLEISRVQRASFFTSAAADSSLRPAMEIIYTLPADFSGGAR